MLDRFADRAWILMTAMPPTKGHYKLMEFASRLSVDMVEVIVCTQPGEPFITERYRALNAAVSHLPNVHMNQYHRKLPQEPEGHEGFWDMWADILRTYDFRTGDLIVASEDYGKQLAEYVGGVFIPYDVDRELYPGKATAVREQPRQFFEWVLPEFQPYIRKTITIFGAESTGKTTLAKALAKSLNGHFLFEYARPYLEHTSPDLSDEAMVNIWRGQLALQRQGQELRDKPFVFQDTDLFSTVGYWEMAPWELAGPDKVPYYLIEDAHQTVSDLYIILKSTIPFEQDPLRYGGDRREINDEQWVDFADRYELPYVEIETGDFGERLFEAGAMCRTLFENSVTDRLNYRREGKEYE